MVVEGSANVSFGQVPLGQMSWINVSLGQFLLRQMFHSDYCCSDPRHLDLVLIGTSVPFGQFSFGIQYIRTSVRFGQLSFVLQEFGLRADILHLVNHI
jgi:hypothetical protein